MKTDKKELLKHLEISRKENTIIEDDLLSVELSTNDLELLISVLSRQI